MLPSKLNLKGDKNFERVEKEGQLFQFGFFAISVYDRKDKEPSRFGFIVSTKISKDSVHRNRVKRAMKSAVRYSLVDTKEGKDAVFLAKKDIVKKSVDEIMRDVKEAMGKVGLLK